MTLAIGGFGLCGIPEALIDGASLDFRQASQRYGRAKDLVARVRRVVILMEHTAGDAPKLLRSCTLPLTGKAVVSRIITDLCVLDVTPQGLALVELAPAMTHAEVQQATAATVHIP